MKKILEPVLKSAALALPVALLLFASCGKDDNSSETGVANPNGTFSVTGVSLSQTTLTLEEGATAVLAATVSPSNATNKGVEWSSANAAVARISEGTVTAVRAGETTVTATTVDGGYTASCKVTVTASNAPSVTYDARVSAIGAALSGKANVLSSSMSSDFTMGMMLSEQAGMLPTNSTKIVATDIGADYSYEVYFHRLKPETVYYYRSYISQKGTDTYGEIKTFTTPPAVETLEAEEVGPHTATLKGKLNLLPEDYEYHMSVLYGMSVDGKNISTKNADEEGYFTVRANGLASDASYRYCAYVDIDKEIASSGYELYYSGETLYFNTDPIAVTGVSLDITSCSVYVYQDFNLHATVSPSDASNPSVSWSVDNPEVLSIQANGSNATVTALAEGTATVTVTTEDGGLTASCKVTVHKVSVQGISLSTAETSLYVGDSFTLTASVEPSNATDRGVSWSVDNAEVLEISENGTTATVTAKSEGEATVTVTTEDGGLTASCKLQVNPFVLGAIDMGLSVKWANANIGASSSEDYGDYYAWGETEIKTTYSWGTYKWCNGSSSTITKYNASSFHGTADNKTVLESEDDVAHVKLGDKWRMPTDEEWTELQENCTWTWTTQNGVNGRLVTSKKNGNSIFLPAAGYRYDDNLDNAGYGGNYWSASLHSRYPSYAWDVRFGAGGVNRNYINRYYGRSVRPVTE